MPAKKAPPRKKAAAKKPEKKKSSAKKVALGLPKSSKRGQKPSKNDLFRRA